MIRKPREWLLQTLHYSVNGKVPFAGFYWLQVVAVIPNVVVVIRHSASAKAERGMTV